MRIPWNPTPRSRPRPPRRAPRKRAKSTEGRVQRSACPEWRQKATPQPAQGRVQRSACLGCRSPRLCQIQGAPAAPRGCRALESYGILKEIIGNHWNPMEFLWKTNEMPWNYHGNHWIPIGILCKTIGTQWKSLGITGILLKCHENH